MDEFDAYDVVKELRDAQDSPHWQRDSYKYMCKVAADEIEKLRAALREIRCTCDEHCNPYKSGCDNWIAHKALGDE